MVVIVYVPGVPAHIVLLVLLILMDAVGNSFTVIVATEEFISEHVLFLVTALYCVVAVILLKESDVVVFETTVHEEPLLVEYSHLTTEPL